MLFGGEKWVLSLKSDSDGLGLLGNLVIPIKRMYHFDSLFDII